MHIIKTASGLIIGLLASSSAIAADLLPLKQGIFVPTNVACKGAANAYMVNYWGGKNGIGVAQASCTIKSMTRRANVYTLREECRDNQSGGPIEGGPNVLTIVSPTRFTMGGTTYRYCGPKPVW